MEVGVSGYLVRAEAVEIAATIDTEMDWPDHLAMGKLGAIWGKSQNIGATEATGKQLQKWAGVSGTEGEKFLGLLQAKGFLEPKGDDYLIVGNEGEIQRIADYIAQRSEAGKKSAEKKRQRREAARLAAENSTAVERPLQRDDNECSNETATKTQPSSSTSTSSSSSTSPSTFSLNARAPARTRVDPKKEKGEVSVEDFCHGAVALAMAEASRQHREPPPKGQAESVAQKAIPADVMDLLRLKYPSWDEFAWEFQDQCRRGYRSAFEAKLTKQLIGMLAMGDAQ